MNVIVFLSVIIVAMIHTGFTLFWAGLANLAAAWLLRRLIAATRPFMYDARLKPLTDRYQASHGFPRWYAHFFV
jgi:hypothetical protein